MKTTILVEVENTHEHLDKRFAAGIAWWLVADAVCFLPKLPPGIRISNVTCAEKERTQGTDHEQEPPPAKAEVSQPEADIAF